MGRKEALKLAAEVDQIIAAKGSKVVNLDLRKDKPSEDEVVALLLGPTGNLRAPTIKQGRKLLVGFNEDAYDEVLG